MLSLWHKTPSSLVEFDKNPLLLAYISLKACISLRVGMKDSTRLSLAEYFYTQGLLFLTRLQVLSLVWVTGPLSQALHLSRLMDADLEDQVRGQDLILFNYVILRIHCVEDFLKLCFISAAQLCILICKTFNHIILLPLCCYGCMNLTTYVWITCRDP